MMMFMDTLEKNIKEYDNDKYDKLAYDNCTLCHICNEEHGEDRVRDYCHLSGKFRGTANEVCNLTYKDTRFINFSQLYFTICLAMIVTYLLKHWEIAKEIFLTYQIMKKTTFLSRNRSSLTNLLIRKEKR